MRKFPAFGRDARVNGLLGAGHFLSHFYQLCLPPLFIVWQKAFDVSFAELGLAMAVMSAAAALMQTPMGFLVDRYGARPFLVGGTALMTLSIAAMGLATSYWQIVALALLSGVGNSVIHPADYSILSGSVDRARLGRSFAFHTFVGNIGFAVAPPATAALALLLGWRGALILVGLLGMPVVLTILWQSRILVDQRHERQPRRAPAGSGARLLLGRSVMMFFAFFMVSSMAGAGVQSWLITILHRAHGMPVAAASSVLTGYMVGAICGVLLGGWVADRTERHLPFVVVLTTGAAAVLLWVGIVPMAQLTGRRGDVRRRRHDRGEPHPARRDGQGRRPAGRDRQSLRLCQLGHVVGRCDHAGALRPDHRRRPPAAGAGRRRGAVDGEPPVRRRRPPALSPRRDSRPGGIGPRRAIPPQ